MLRGFSNTLAANVTLAFKSVFPTLSLDSTEHHSTSTLTGFRALGSTRFPTYLDLSVPPQLALARSLSLFLSLSLSLSPSPSIRHHTSGNGTLE